MIRQQAGVIVLAIKDAGGKMIFNPAAETVIRTNDYLIVIGGDDGLKKLEALAKSAAAAS